MRPVLAQVSFPVEGPLRLPMLVMEFIFVVLCYDLAVIFVLKYRRQERKAKQLQELGFAGLFSGFATMWLFYIIADYYTSDAVTSPFLAWAEGSWRALLTNVGYMASIFAIFAFMAIVEHYRRLVGKRRLFTALYGCLIPPYLVLFAMDLELARTAMFAFVIIFAVFFLLFLADLGKNIERRKGVAAAPFLLATFLALFIGYVLTFDLTMNAMGPGIRIVGSTMQLASFIAFFLVFVQLPPLASLDWKKLIDFVYIFDKGGMCMVQRAYMGQDKGVDDNLVSSALSTVGSILEEMTSTSRGISSIKRKGKVVTMYSGELVNGAIIGNEENEFLARILRNFIDTFESIYRGDIARWNGEIDTFASISGWMDRVFS